MNRTLLLLLTICSLFCGLVVPKVSAQSELSYEVERSTIAFGDEEFSWFQCRGTFVPGEDPICLVTLQQRKNNYAHGYYDVFSTRSIDFGATWSKPTAIDSLRRKKQSDGYEVVAGDLWLTYHPPTDKVVATGKTFNFRDGEHEDILREAVAYAVYDPRKDTWTDLNSVEIPEEPDMLAPNAGCNQPLVMSNGEFLVPIRYQKSKEQRNYITTVMRSSFDGSQLSYKAHGALLTHPHGRGFYEPSLASFAGDVFLTLRTDKNGYVAKSSDGMNFDAPIAWSFDDGSPLNSINTQQHWITHSDGLFLLYTRKTEKNKHIFRYRAPLFMAQIDTKTLRVIRSTEKVIVPEEGRTLGNFGVMNVSKDQTWVITSEGPPAKGAAWDKNRVILAKIKWSNSNEQ